ncbi:HlyD family type I secretion periplasmic adaptor subunit [Herbaspirillum sp. alder98]|uniref:HlyD family type I secretion periplasmic adaptor subunit n=1 Tax=Herbaspirillum sp. alder98 TaxID=2913096 RepID=UPI001CD84469|nr:HlyD family type I secretion periplasmic adaptor subunit [Herbaspirillum sp. alder98]MCA1323594.1 HlyD family type I secretion periplasmic adaptor subunit [Herbaspirillum sp. alder98]
MSLRYRVAAIGHLLRHYGEVFVHYWRRRQSMDRAPLTSSEAEFLPAALALQEQPISSTARITARVLMALLACALLWSIFGRMDIIVNAGGKLIPSGYTKTITSVDVAAVKTLHVFEGKQVQQGDLLLELDSSAPDAEHDRAAGERSAALMQAARAQALLRAIATRSAPLLPPTHGVDKLLRQAAQAHVEGQYADFNARLSRIDSDIGRFAAALPLAVRRAEDYRILAADHDVPIHAWMEKEQARMDLQGQLNNARAERAVLVAQVKKEAYDALTEGEKAAASSQQEALRAGSHSRLLQLRAPVSGTVQQLVVHTQGSAVPSAQPLMLIVPRQGGVEVEAFLENKDVGFVQEGQAAMIKVDAFEYTKYGVVPAVVTNVSRDAIQDEKRGLIYAVKMKLERPEIQIGDRLVALAPGMSVSAEIRTGTRRVIEYVLSPLLQHQREALSER